MKNTLLKAHFFIFIILLSFAHFEPTQAQIRNQVFVGTRPLSLGETFVAIADDGNAIYWNPAGLARMERIQISGAYANLFGLDIDSYYASFLSRLYFIPPLTDYLSFGVAWSGFQTSADDEEFVFSQDQFNFALALKPPKSWPFLRDFGFGMNAKYLQINGKLDGATEADLSGWGWDFGMLYDLSALHYAPKGLNFGLMIHDVGGTNVVHDTGVTENEFQRQNIRWGLSYRPLKEWRGEKPPLLDPLFAIDIDDRVHFGMELWLAQTLALRFGLQKDRHTDESMTFSFGIGLQKNNFGNWPGVQIDYALSDPPTLPNTSTQFGGSIILKNNPRLIRIEGAHINDVFASLYLHYGKPGGSIGTVKLRNVSRESLKAWVSFEEDQFMASQEADTLTLEPGVPVHFPLRADFKPGIFSAPRGKISANVRITYRYRNDEFTTTAPLDFELYEKNYLTWDDPAKAAAFVSYDDETVNKFKAEALKQKYGDEKTHWFLRYNMANALNIFHALKAYGFEYSRDPITAFPELTKYRPDKIWYPAQLLTREKRSERIGDCDDLSVLYASLLQNGGIPTALVSEPKHLFMMFDTGISESQIYVLPIPSTRFVKHNGNLWIPIDAAQIPNLSFTEAWKRGSDKFRKGSTKIDSVFDVAVSQKKYPPAAIEQRPAWRPVIPDFSIELQKDLDALLELKSKYLQTFENNLARENLPKPDRITTRNFYGAVLGQNNEYIRAKEQFQRVLADSSTFAPAWNNLANIEFILGNFERAESLYVKAKENALFNHGIYLNMAILYQMMKQGASPKDTVYYQGKSEEAIKQAARLFRGDAPSVYAYVGYPEESVAGKAEGDVFEFIKKVIDNVKKIKRFVDRSFKKIVKKDKVKVVLDRHGSKGRGETDEDRWALLFWSYQKTNTPF